MNAEAPTTTLVAIEPADARVMFTADNPAEAFAAIIGKVRAIVGAWDRPDVTTVAGRKEIASMAYKVARSKGYLEAIGKELAAEAKRVPAKIDASRRHVEAELDRIRDDIRAPLDQWEAAEEAKKTRAMAAFARLEVLTSPPPTMPAEDIRAALDEIDRIEAGDAAYANEIALARDKARAALKSALDARAFADAEAAELAALRAEKAARDAHQETERRARELKEATERAATDAAARAKADLEAEIAAKAQAEEAETKRREANKAHRAKINRAAVSALVGAGIGEDSAKAIITMIAKGEVPHVSISY